MLTLFPIEWTRQTSSGISREPIVYEVAGLAGGRRAAISMAPGGWRLVDELFTGKADPEARYPTPEEALEALKAQIERGDTR